jgi:hypothetical protein
MSNIVRGGFHPRRGIACVAKPRRYEVPSGYATALFPGDLVTLDTTGTVKAIAAGSGTILGAIAHVSYWSGTPARQYGQYVPANTTYSPTSRGSYQATYVYVWDDPSIEYIASVKVATTAALNYAGVGANMNVATDAGDTTYGRSGHKLDGTYVAGDAQMRILEMLRMTANDLTSQFQQVVCMINDGFHPFFSNAGI